jgi:hypothetical protein
MRAATNIDKFADLQDITVMLARIETACGSSYRVIRPSR